MFSCDLQCSFEISHFHFLTFWSPCHVQAWWLYHVESMHASCDLSCSCVCCLYRFTCACCHGHVWVETCGLTCVNVHVHVRFCAQYLLQLPFTLSMFVMASAMGNADPMSASMQYWPLRSEEALLALFPAHMKMQWWHEGQPRFSIGFWHGTWWLSAKYENLWEERWFGLCI